MAIELVLYKNGIDEYEEITLEDIENRRDFDTCNC